jgi:hypothetical protein
MEQQKPDMGFKDLLNSLMQKRWYVTAIVLGLFVLITAGIFAAIVMQVPMAAAWKELLMLLLGAFIGSYGKIIDYYYSDSDKDKLLVAKMDEENDSPEMLMAKMNKGISSGQLKETNKTPTPIIPDAFVQGAAAARELAVVENKQNYDMSKDEQEHRQAMAVDQQEHAQEMEKLEFEHHTHRQCKHVWGDADHDGQLECQNCGLLKESWDESH